MPSCIFQIYQTLQGRRIRPSSGMCYHLLFRCFVARVSDVLWHVLRQDIKIPRRWEFVFSCKLVQLSLAGRLQFSVIRLQLEASASWCRIATNSFSFCQCAWLVSDHSLCRAECCLQEFFKQGAKLFTGSHLTSRFTSQSTRMHAWILCTTQAFQS